MTNICIVEDNLYFRNALIRFLTSHEQFQVTGEFDDVETAGRELPKLKPDIAIVDLNLHGKSGADLIRVLRNELPDTQFFVLTVHDENERVFEALAAGATGYLLKDASSEQIRSALLELQNGGSPMSPFIARKVISYYQKRQPTADSRLTEREREVLDLIAGGKSYKEVAQALNIHRDTVNKHLQKIYRKLNVQNKLEAINKIRNS